MSQHGSNLNCPHEQAWAKSFGCMVQTSTSGKDSGVHEAVPRKVGYEDEDSSLFGEKSSTVRR